MCDSRAPEQGADSGEVYVVAIRDPDSDYTARERMRVYGPRDLESHMAALREKWAGYEFGTPRREG